jgi:hypothetical protein
MQLLATMWIASPTKKAEEVRMRTGFTSRSGVVLLLAGLAIAAVSPTAGAQSRRFGVIGIGSFGRLGSVPRAFDQGIPVAIEATVQWPLIGPLQIATSADLTVQRIGTSMSLASLNLGLPDPIVRRPYSFDVVHFGAGPAFSAAVGGKLRLSGSVQGTVLVPSWGSTAVGICEQGCALLGPSPEGQQTEFRWGASGRLRLTFGARDESRLGLEVLGIAGPRHSGSQIPLSTIAFMLVIGAS